MRIYSNDSPQIEKIKEVELEFVGRLGPILERCDCTCLNDEEFCPRHGRKRSHLATVVVPTVSDIEQTAKLPRKSRKRRSEV